MSRAADPPWTLAELIDFEFLLASEPAAPGAAEREAFERHLAPFLKDGAEASRKAVFKAWVEAHRDPKMRGETLPGAHFAASWQTLLTLSALAGLFLGGSLVAALLHYKGDEPVNVWWFLICTVGVQILLLLAVALVWLIRSTTHFFENLHPIRWVVSALLWTFGAGLRRLSGEQRTRLQTGLAVIARKREIYGSLATWPLLLVTQTFAVAYNLGMLAILLAHVTTTDLAFGWQSTLQTSPEEVHRLVSSVAAPWRWLLPNAHPSLAQIVESRFQYSTGLKPLSQVAMTSWWPFLCYTIAFYGLFLRGALLMFSALKMRSSLGGLTFTHQECNALYRRLTGPTIQAQSGTAIFEMPTMPEGSAEAPASRPAVVARGGLCLALVASELDLSADSLSESVARKFGWRLETALPAQIDHPSGNAEVFAQVSARAGALAGIVVVVRAKRSPIKAIALFLEKVVAAAGDTKPEILILLLGKKAGDTFLLVDEEELAHWRNFNEIHRLHLGLETWSPAS